MPESILEIRGLTKHFGGIVATDDLSLEVETGEIHALIGPNGAGKTTLVNLLSGQLRPESGTIRFDGLNITRRSTAARTQFGLVRSFQITSIFKDFTVLDNVALATQARAGHSFRFWRPARGDPRLAEPAQEALARVGLEDREHVPAGDLAHGEQRQLEIAIALATRPRMLLLDEPTAGMGGEDTERMIALLDSLRGPYTILLIEHDMDAVFTLADRITVLVYGRAIASGTPEKIRADDNVRQAYLGDDAVAP